MLCLDADLRLRHWSVRAGELFHIGPGDVGRKIGLCCSELRPRTIIDDSIRALTTGREVLREFFSRFFSAGGGITLEHCTVTEDGTRTALEFNAVKWGSVEMPPQAGVAVYERGASGRLSEARIYDDVEGPVE